MSRAATLPRVLPGFGLSLGFTLAYLSLIVLIPLSAVFIRSSALPLDAFWDAVTAPRVLARSSVLEMQRLISIDTSGLDALVQLRRTLERRDVALLLVQKVANCFCRDSHALIYMAITENQIKPRKTPRFTGFFKAQTGRPRCARPLQ